MDSSEGLARKVAGLYPAFVFEAFQGFEGRLLRHFCYFYTW